MDWKLLIKRAKKFPESPMSLNTIHEKEVGEPKSKPLYEDMRVKSHIAKTITISRDSQQSNDETETNDLRLPCGCLAVEKEYQYVLQKSHRCCPGMSKKTTEEQALTRYLNVLYVLKLPCQCHRLYELKYNPKNSTLTKKSFCFPDEGCRLTHQLMEENIKPTKRDWMHFDW